jgi:mRNA interferase RelE/StbE
VQYRIEFSSKALRQLEKIPSNISETIVDAIETRLSVDPHRFKPLGHNLKGLFRLRVANYRILYRIEEEIVTVIVVKIGVRSNVYDD